MVELLDHLRLESVAFWGYSSGISPGVRLAERDPARLWALVASGAVGPPDTPEQLAAWVESTAAAFRKDGWEKLIAGFEAQEVQPIPDWMKERIRVTDFGQFVDFIESLPDWHWEEWDVLPKLNTPTLFVTGELEDRDDNVGEMVARMRAAELLRFPGLGHINAYLETSSVLPRVHGFLAQHAPRD